MLISFFSLNYTILHCMLRLWLACLFSSLQNRWFEEMFWELSTATQITDVVPGFKNFMQEPTLATSFRHENISVYPGTFPIEIIAFIKLLYLSFLLISALKNSQRGSFTVL